LKHRNSSQHHLEKASIAVTTSFDITKQKTAPEPSQFSNDQSNLVLDSPTEMEPAEDGALETNSWKAPAYLPPPEPKWQMISPSQKTPSTASSYQSSYRKRSPSLASSSRTHFTRQSDDSDDLDIPNNKMTPVEISIARQISMSRQQRKLLQPLRTGPSPSPSPGTGTGTGRRPSRPTPVVTVGQNERLAKTKTATPTLVNPPEMLGSNLALPQNRRSERIVLEGA
jgi:hypothetical protein